MLEVDLQTAISLHRAGNLPQAEALYRQILAADPQNAEALQLLGLIACQQNDLPAASDLIARAIAITPHNAEFHINLAEVKRRMSRLDEAEVALRRAAELAPQNAFVWYNLGVVLGNWKPAEARDAFARAVLIEPRLAEGHNNLALLQHDAGEFEAAIESFRRALALRPGHAETENNLGLSLWPRSRREHDALASFKAAIRARPEFAAAHLNLGTALRKLGRRSEALATLRRAAELDAGAPETQRELGRALVDTGRVEDGIEACRRAAELGPDQAENWQALAVALVAKAVRDPSPDSMARTDAIAAYERALELQPAAEWAFELAAVRGQTPPAPPDAFIRAFYDEVAPRFENHLMKELHYRVPQELLAETLRLSPEPPAHWHILDLGCGTGLCGEFFRPHAAAITGIDLSPNMAERSRRRGNGKIYDQVLCAPALDALRRFENQFDLITAADFFICVGGMEEILPAAARALRPGGMLAFSLERHDGEAYLLHRRQRYAHSLNYVRGIAHTAGLIELAARETNLRDDAPAGIIMILQKPNSTGSN